MPAFNKFIVGLRLDGYVMVQRPFGPLTKDDAINLAAHLVAIADPGREKFDRVLEEVTSS